MLILYDATGDNMEVLGVFTAYNILYDYAKAYAENRYGEECYEEYADCDELTFVGKETNVITIFMIAKVSLNPVL